MKRFLSVVLSVLMIANVLPHSVIAASFDTSDASEVSLQAAGKDDPCKDGHDYVRKEIDSYHTANGMYYYECSRCHVVRESDITNEVFDPEGYPESEHDYANNMDFTWEYTAPKQCSSLEIVFSASCDLESGCDKVYIYTLNDVPVGTYTGSELSGKTVKVPGKGFRIRMTTDYSVVRYGFRIDSITGRYITEESVHSKTPSYEYSGTVYPTETVQGHSVYTCAECGTEYTVNEIGENVDGINYVFDTATKKLTISGNGKVPDYYDNDTPFTDFRSYIKSVEIGAGITGLGNYLFSNCTNLETVNFLPREEKVKVFTYNGHYYALINRAKYWNAANEDCTGMGGYLASVTSAEEDGFLYEIIKNAGTGETSYWIGGNDAAAEGTWTWSNGEPFSYANWNRGEPNDQNGQDYARIYCSSGFWDDAGDNNYNNYYYICEWDSEKDIDCAYEVVSADYQNAVNEPFYLGRNVFWNCVNLTEINLPDSITSIGAYDFWGCSKLENITIPEGIETVGEYAFLDCTLLDNVVFPESMRTVYHDAFNGCRNLHTVTLNEGLKALGYACFNGCSIGEITIPKTVLSMNFTGYSNAAQTACFGSGDSYASALYGSNAKKVIFAEDSEKIPQYALYNTTVSEIVVPQSVTKIERYAFSSSGLVEVTLGANITAVEERAFYNCQLLEKVGFGEGTTLDTIGSYMFASCPLLKEFTVPASVTTIGDYAFSDCTRLGHIDFSKAASLEKIGSNAFYSCRMLDDVVLPGSVKSVGNYAFAYCYNLSHLELNEGLATIGQYCLIYTYALKELHIPSTVTSVGSNLLNSYSAVRKVTFADGTKKIPDGVLNCESNVDTVVIPDSVTEIGSYSFAGNSLLTEIDLPENLKTIGSYAFYNGYQTKIVISAKVTTIGSYAFYGNDNASEIDLSGADALTTISDYAFWNCSSAKELILPPNVKTIGRNAFSDWYELEKAELNEGLTTIRSGAFANTPALCEITIPSTVTTADSGIFSEASGIKKVTFAEGMTKIPSNMLYCNALIEEAVLPESLKTIGNSAFRSLKNLKKVNFPSRLRTIESYAFYDCYSLGSIELNDDLETIESYAFESCGLTDIGFGTELLTIGQGVFSNNCSLRSVTFPKALQTVGSYAFQNCYELESVTFPADSRLKTIGSYAWSNCRKLSSFEFPASVTSVSDYVFNGCISLDTVSFAEDTIDIPNRALYGADFVETVMLPSTAKTVGSYAFANMYRLKNIDFPDRLRTISEGAFYDDRSLKAIDLGCVEGIGQYAFYSCDELRDVDFGTELTTIGYRAFDNCDSLTQIELPPTVRTVSDYAFQNCSYLRSVSIPSRYISISGSVFRYCTNLTFICQKDSDAYNYAADHNFKIKETLSKLNAPVRLAANYVEFSEPIAEPVTAEIVHDAEPADELTEQTEPKLPETRIAPTAPAVNTTAPVPAPVLMSGNVSSNDFHDEATGLYYNIDGAVTGYDGKNADVVIPGRLGSVVIVSVANDAFRDNVDIESVVLPDTVKKIGQNAFRNCEYLAAVRLPKELSTVGSSAFYGCKDLRSVTVPTSVTSCGSDIFAGCTKLTKVVFEKTNSKAIPSYILYNCTSVESVEIPDNITTFGSYAFYNCTELSDIELPDGLLFINDYAFYNCDHLTRIDIPASTDTIGANAFRDCSRLVKVGYAADSELRFILNNAFYSCESLVEFIAPDKLISIGESAFNYCSSIEEIKIKSCIIISRYAFANCTYVRSIEIPANVKSIDSNVFAGCSRLTKVSFADGTVRIPDNTFRGANSITDVTMPDSVKIIGASAFYGCDQLESIVLPKDLTTINSSAFYNCAELRSVNIPASVREIGDSAFYGCSRLTSLSFEEGSVLREIRSSAFRECGALESLTLPASVHSIRSYAFYGCGSLADVVLPEGLMTIESYAFRECTDLARITIPKNTFSCSSDIFYGSTKLETVSFAEGTIRIPANVLYNCVSVKTVNIPDSVISIGDSAFRGCTSLQMPDLDGIRYIGSYAFCGCNSLESVTIPSSMITVGSNAFQNCTALKDVSFEDGHIWRISQNTFRGCPSLESVSLPEGLLFIDSYAFMDCASLGEITLPESISYISGDAFRNDTSLTEFTFPKYLTDTDSGILNGCTNLKKVIFADGTKFIPSNAVRNNTNVTEAVIPDSVTEIRSYAFADCAGLESVVIPKNVLNVREYAFSNCKALKNITVKSADTVFDSRVFYNNTALETLVLPSGYDEDTSWGGLRSNAFEGSAIPSIIKLGNKEAEFSYEDGTVNFEGHVYTVVTDLMPYEEAVQYSLAQGGHLVTVTSRAEEYIVELLASRTGQSRVWLYATDEDSEGYWYYPNGEDYDYNCWSESQPDNSGSNEHYAVYDTSFTRWNDANASNAYASICEWDSTVGQRISLTVTDKDGNDVTNEVGVSWYKGGQLVSRSSTLSNYTENKNYSFEIILSDELSKTYALPTRQTVNITGEEDSITFRLTPIPTVTVSGTVKSNEGIAISGAQVVFTQTVNGIHKNTVTVSTDAKGKYTAELVSAPTTVTVSAPEYYTKTAGSVEASFGTGKTAVLPETVLKPLIASRVSLSLIRLSAAKYGEEAQTETLTDTAGLEVSLWNKTQKKPITAYTLRYPYILLEEGAVRSGDTVELTCTDTTGRTTADKTDFTLDANCNGSVTVVLTENGRIALHGIGGEEGYFMLFDAEGRYVAVYNAENGLVTDELASGAYKCVFIKKTSLLRRVSDISRLTELGLRGGQDFVTVEASVENGIITEVGNITVPSFDESKLYYTDDEKTMLSASRYSLTQGKLLTLKAEYSIEDRYDAAEQYVEIVMPDGVQFIENSVTLNGSLANYDYNEKTHTVKVYTNADNAIVRLSASGIDIGTHIVESCLGFRLDGSDVYQPTGSVSLNITAGDWTVPDITGRKRITISGTSITSSEVKIFDNDEPVSETTTNKSGSWKATFDLPGEKDSYREHNIHTVITSKVMGYSVKSETKKLKYDPDYVTLSKITMINTAHDGTTREFITEMDFENPSGKKLSYNYWPAYPTFTFIVELTTDDAERVSNMIVITKNADGDETYVPCVFDEETGTWIGKQDYYNSREKPAAVTAVYDFNAPERKTLLIDFLDTCTDVSCGTLFFTRYYSTDTSSFMRSGIFGYGWQTNLEIGAELLTDDVILIKTVGNSDILEKAKDGFVSQATGATAVVRDGCVIYTADGTSYEFNESGRIVRIADGNGNEITYTWDGEKLDNVVTAAGDRLTFTYSDGVVTSVTGSNGEKAEYAYDGNYLKSVTVDGDVLSYSYITNAKDKSNGALCEIEYIDGGHVYYEYDSYGRVVRSYEDNNVNLVEYKYEGANKVTSVANGASEEFVYGEDGLLTSYKNDKGFGYSLEYNDRLDISRISFTDGTAKVYGYDEDGNTVSATVIGADGKEITPASVSYNDDKNETVICDGNGNATTYKYEEGALARITYPDNSFESFEYDTENDTVTRTDRNGNVTVVRYNDQGIASTTTNNAEQRNIEYNTDGSVKKIAEGDKSASFTYDDEMNISAVTYGDKRTVRYTWGEAHMLTSVTDSEGYVTNYTYDAYGRVSRLTDKSGKLIASYEYNNNSMVTKQTNGNGSYTTYEYDGQLCTAINNYDGKSQTPVSFFRYEYDMNGYVRKMTDKSGVWSYEYDLLGQLVKVTQPDKTTVQYVYDAAGNRVKEISGKTETKYTVNNLNQYTNAGEKTYTYDKNGNVITETENGITTTYTYDASNRCISISDGTDMTTYEYDVFGNRTKEIRNGEVTEYVWSPIGSDCLVTAYFGDGSTADYVTGGRLTGAVIDGEAYFYNFNLLGSTSEITDKNAKPVNSYTYDVQGSVTTKTEGVFNPFTYVGAYGVLCDGDDLYYVRTRFVDTDLGRFISADPAGQYYGVNEYVYVDNNPVSNIDISGDFVITGSMIAAAVLSGVISVGVDIACDYASAKITGEDYKFTDHWKSYAVSFGFGAVTSGFGSALAGAEKAGKITKAASTAWSIGGKAGLNGLKSVTDDIVNGRNVDWGKAGFAAGFSAVCDGVSKLAGKAVEKLDKFLGSKVFKVYENGRISTWINSKLADSFGFVRWLNTNSAQYKSMITKIFKNGQNWNLGVMLKRTLLTIPSKLLDKLSISDWLKDKIKNFFENLFGIDDPSGYVYEAVPSNRLEGVTATAYTVEEYYDDYGQLKEDIVFWDAEEFDQENPLVTNSFGQYAWDVPTGKWQVKYEKAGYTTAYSEWLDVPPPQTEVNIGLVSTEAPKVESIAVYNDGVQITFSQYMDIASVNPTNVTVNVGTKKVNGTIVPLNEEAGGKDPSVSYASVFMFVPDEAISGSSAKVTVGSVVNYAGKTIAKSYSTTSSVRYMPKAVEAKEEISVTRSQKYELPIRVDIGEKAAGSILTVTSSTPSVASVIGQEVVVGLDGVARVLLEAHLPGNAEISYSIKDTTVSGTTKVMVEMPDEETEHVHTPGEEATCTTNQTCTECGQILVPALGHSFTVHVASESHAANCTEDGQDVYKCERCGEKQTETLKSPGHKTVTGPAVSPGCTEAGLTEGSYCSVCGEVFKAQEKVPAFGHEYADGKCIRCGESDPAAASVPGDTNGDGKVTSKDASVFSKYLAGWQIEIDLTAADTNGDGKINGKDLSLIMKYLAGWDVKFAAAA